MYWTRSRQAQALLEQAYASLQAQALLEQQAYASCERQAYASLQAQALLEQQAYASCERQAYASREQQAVEALLELHQGNQGPPAFHRSLSQQQTALSRAQELFPSTQPGETILMNFFIDANGYATIQYMKNEAGKARVHRMEGPLVTTQWTYEVTDFPFR